jgi:hypothetical protein
MGMFSINILHTLGDLLSSPDGREEVKKYINSPEGQQMVKNFMATPEGKEIAGQLMVMILGNLDVPEPVKQSVQQYIRE